MLSQGALCFKSRLPCVVVTAWIASGSCPDRLSSYSNGINMLTCRVTGNHGDVLKPFHSVADDSHGLPDSYKQQKGLMTPHDPHRYGNRLTQQWTVPRTNLNHFPEETRRIIQQKQNATTLTNGKPARGGHLVEKCMAALEYERHMDYVDFVGRNGEHFSSWMHRHLKEFENLISSHPETFNLLDYTTLLGLLRDEYLGFDSRKQRESVVQDCETVLLTIEKQLRDVPKPEEPSQRNQDGTLGQGVEKEQMSSKVSTADFRSSFMQRALEAQHEIGDSQDPNVGINDLQGDQRTEMWKNLRSSRLTASAFSKALGFFAGDRVSLWEEKIGVREPFKGNDATRWGTMNEAKALLTYEKLTGQKVESCMFKVKKDDVVHDWLGASPDGLVAGLGLLQEQSIDSGTDDTFLGSGSMGPGVLEIKCPFNKGRPDLAEPPKRAIWYYMPQIQGLMDVFDREWCILYVWTPKNGSSSFIIARDREYWSTCFDVLAEFWWSYTVPARQVRSLQKSIDEDIGENHKDPWLHYKPSEYHPKSEMLKEWSKRIAWSSPGKVFPHVKIE